MITKIISYGFLINGPNSYLRTGWNILGIYNHIISWNILDFVIVNMALVSIFIDDDGGNLKNFKILRTLRVLRPLRLISRNEGYFLIIFVLYNNIKGLKLVINSLFLSIPNIFNLIFVCVIFFILFGIIAVNSFKGPFYSNKIEF